MKYLLDTCLISELMRTRPDAGVLDWVRNHDEIALYLSALTLGEIEKGIAKLAAGQKADQKAKRAKLETWLRDDLRMRFEGRILPVSDEICLRWGRVSADAELRGEKIPVIDGLIAATALVHGLTVVTRDAADIERAGAKIVNPWR
ncbi:MAG: type II toxin-antitoxin system VapC family toxin [Deltaproteobacteria bacterium]|nr:type II toxin-antitoxin system VapC family toxin [Deltaproteobacteria bacterium]